MTHPDPAKALEALYRIVKNNAAMIAIRGYGVIQEGDDELIRAALTNTPASLSTEAHTAAMKQHGDPDDDQERGDNISDGGQP